MMRREHRAVVGSPCVCRISPTRQYISRMVLNESITIAADPVRSRLSGIGSRSINRYAGVSRECLRIATVSIRWPGSGVDVQVPQIGFELLGAC